MSTVSKSIEVDVPASIAFMELTAFEALPRFMPGVIAVTQRGERHLSWRAHVFGIERVWELEITEIAPEQRVAWSSLAGPRNYGSVHLEPRGADATRITMEVHYDPTGVFEEITDYLGVLDRWVERSLECFKELMEQPSSTLGGLPPVEHLVGH
jgi:uncharacterized membrane protein